MPTENPLSGASPALVFALTVRFLLELALLSAAWFVASNLTTGNWLAPVAAVAGIGIVWGLFISPKARIKLPRPAVLAIEGALFFAVAIGLYALGFQVAAIVGLTVWALDQAAITLLRPPRTF